MHKHHKKLFLDLVNDETYINYISKFSKFQKEARLISVTTISLLMLFQKIIVVHYENHTKAIYTPCGQNTKLLNVIYHVVLVVTGML
jgi:hypothetical protein